MHIEEQQLKTFLLDSGLVSERDLAAASARTEGEKRSLGDVLVTEGKLTEEDLARVKAHILGIPFVSLTHERIPADVLRIIPEPIARRHNIVAYRKNGESLEVAMLDPADLETVAFIKKKAKLKILPRLTDVESVKHVLRQYQQSLEAEFGDVIQKESVSIIAPEGEDVAPEALQKLAEELPVVRIVDTMLRHAVTQRASDIHIEPEEEVLRVRYRIDGILHDAMELPKQAAAAVVARVKVLAQLKLDEHRLPQDGRFKIEESGERISFRVSVLPVYDGEKVVLRLLSERTAGFSLESLGLWNAALEHVHRALRQTVGIVLVTGPTGSGKTTTLYTMLDILNTPGVNIATIEDPVEYRLARVNQTQVRPDIGLSFANGLRALVRQDPDIIMVGEIRDAETAKLAIHAALTGHLVFSTLHTNSAAGALPRLLDMGVEPFLIVSTVSLIAAQRLVRRLCQGKRAYRLNEAQYKELAGVVDMKRALTLLKTAAVVPEHATWKDVTFYAPEPSEQCADGYEERIGIYEILPLSETIKRLVMQRASIDDITALAISEGMSTMVEDGLLKAAQGITSIEEVLRVVGE